jgi:hypothetical protein
VRGVAATRTPSARTAAVRRSAAAVGAVVTVAVAGCTGPSYPDDVAAYLPDTLGGRTVVVDDPRATSVASAIDGGGDADGVVAVRAATLVAPDDDPTSTPPVLVVAEIGDGGAATVDAAVFRPVDKVRTVRVGDQEMRMARSRQAGRDVEFTTWRPARGIVVVAAGVDGGRAGARDALAALVAATRPGDAR